VGDGKFLTKFRPGYLKLDYAPDKMSPSAVYNFADELGRFLNEPLTCPRMDEDEKKPVEWVDAGQFKKAYIQYRRIKQEDPLDIYVSENRLNMLGYEYLNKGRFEEAVAIFKLNVEFYPESANCYDSLAEALMLKGDKDRAIINYKRSLELNPKNQNAVSILKKLEAE
jgi:tetratricopeptide (TPR) repeat protein